VNAVDAVELAVRALEDDPVLNAGYGSVLTREGTLELDAGIATSAGGYGAVCGVTVRHPISLARRVMETTPHVLLAGRGAMDFGHDLETLSDTSPEEQARWERASTQGTLTDELYGHPTDTVGAVAFDGTDLAAASSTGGVFGKRPGRVGDAPIFGAGLYASLGAVVVGTGIGELFIQALACYRAGALIEGGEHPQRACERVIAMVKDTRSAGLLALDAEGRVGAAYRGAQWPVEGPDGPVDAVLVG
jgi:beta-aspartyl-peptidase (threonine type)